jgi:iron complex transport system substrate-binding protein
MSEPSRPRRIATLVPSATELAFALGLGSHVVAVTHECDHPERARELPQLTRSVIPPGLDAAAIDAAVRERTERGEALYELDEARLAELEVDLIVTQAVCAVCAVDYDDVVEVARRLPSTPEVLSLDPSTLPEVLADAARFGEAAGEPERGRELRTTLESRIAAVRSAVAGRDRPRVAALEWLDPVYAAGHWVPEMIDAAGGTDVLAEPGEHSRVVSWEEVRAARPDVVLVMPCGLYLDEASAEAARHATELGALGASSVHAFDAAASFSRPGPRLADGVELLAKVLHPDAKLVPTALNSAPVDTTPTP